MCDRTSTSLGDVLTLQRGFDLPESDRRDGPYPVVASTGVVGRHVKAMVNGPGVVIGRSGSLGGGQFIREDFWPLNTTLWVKDFKGNDPRFCFYLLKSLDLASFNAGSGVPTLNRNHIHPMPVTIPRDIGERRAIGEILGSLDDKIDLNRRMNETLEAIARALFKSWFVDFDPVRAKAEGREPPGLSPDLALSACNAQAGALFPARFQESELGMIPEGWEVKALDQVADFMNGLACQKFPADDGDSLPVIKIAQLRAGNTEGADRANLEVPESHIIEDGDVLFSWSGSLEARIWSGGRGVLNQHLFMVTSASHPKWFYYLWTLEHLPWFRDIAANKATTMGHIQRHHLSEAKVIVPPSPTLKAMTDVMGPLLDQTLNNDLQSRTLAVLRDGLLPRLLSGAIAIKETRVPEVAHPC